MLRRGKRLSSTLKMSEILGTPEKAYARCLLAAMNADNADQICVIRVHLRPIYTFLAVDFPLLRAALVMKVPLRPPVLSMRQTKRPLVFRVVPCS